MNREELARDNVAYWELKATDATRAAEYANNQFRLAVEELAALGGMAMGETPPHLTLIQGDLA